MLLVMKCGFSAYLSGVGVNIFLGSLLPGIIYLIANEVCRSRRIALASALLIALNPPMIELAVEPLRDTVYLFFAGLVICLLIFGDRSGIYGGSPAYFLAWHFSPGMRLWNFSRWQASAGELPYAGRQWTGRSC